MADDDLTPQDAYAAYVTMCYAAIAVPRILTFEQFIEDPERVEHHLAAAKAARAHLN